MNPLMQSLMGGNNVLSQISSIKQMLSGQNPNAVMQLLAQNNPQFAQFVSANQGKSAQQIAQENGLDWNLVQSILK